MLNLKNRNYWNIVKGFSILSIVLGHCCYFMVPFVYLYHLAIFFFLTGYFYKEEKYGDNPYLYFVSKIKTQWKRYVLFSVFFVLIHNILVRYGLIVSTNNYDFLASISAIINSFFFYIMEDMGGALWFVPVLIMASSLFGILIYFSRKYSSSSKEKDKSLLKNVLIVLFSFICAILGLYLNKNNASLMFHAQTVLLVLPFFTVGYYSKKCIGDFSKVLKLYIFIFVSLILCYFAYKSDFRIDLVTNVVGNVYLFYPISLLGIYFVLYVSKVIYKIKFIKNYFSFLGKYSFEIMACHFFVFKIIDFIYAHINGITDYGHFPYSFRKLWLVYVLLGSTLPALFFYIKDNYLQAIKKVVIKFLKVFVDNRIASVISILLLIICFSVPIIKLGIMHNDELMSRFWSSKGFLEFYYHYLIEHVQKGRALSCFILPFTMYLGFVGKSTFVFRILQVLSIFSCCYLFTILLNKLFNNKKISGVFCLIFLSFLPISFEPTVPNVFVTLYNIPVCVLIISFILYVDYLNTGVLKKLIISMILFFVVQLSYEAFVTYTVIFLLIYIFKSGIKNIFKDSKAILFPIFCALFYLIIYIIASKIFPSNYAGNQIGGINILKSLGIIFNLSIYTFPGRYLFSDKYKWLFNHYYQFNIFHFIRVIFLLLAFVLLFIKVMCKSKKTTLNIKRVLMLVFISGCAIILPLLPVSVSSMYQELDIGGIVLGLPVSFFGYFGAVLILSVTVVYVIENFKMAKYFIICLLMVGVVGVQSMNSTFAEEASKDFKRLEEIEEFITSGIFEELPNVDIYSTDIFETKNALVVHDNYWNEFANYHNISTNFINDVGELGSNKIYFLEKWDIFELIYNNNIYLISTEILSNDKNISVYVNDDETFELKIADFYMKNGNWKIYCFEIVDGILEQNCNLKLENFLYY